MAKSDGGNGTGTGTGDPTRKKHGSQVRQRPRSASTNSTSPHRMASSPAQGGHSQNAYASPVLRRASTIAAGHLSPAQRRRGNAIYNATHPAIEPEPIASSWPWQPSTATTASTQADSALITTHAVDVLDVHSASMRRAARELMSGAHMRSRRLVVDLAYEHASSTSTMESTSTLEEDNNEDDDDPKRKPDLEIPSRPTTTTMINDATEAVSASHALLQSSKTVSSKSSQSYGSVVTGEGDGVEVSAEGIPLIPSNASGGARRLKPKRTPSSSLSSWISYTIQHTSAVAVVALLNIMVAIPFGASYFPIGWKGIDEPATNTDDATGGEDEDDDVHGAFPLPGKEALGIRMFLFATIIGQLVFTFASRFDNPIGMQMVENVPFLHALCHIVIQEQGYGKEALSTVCFLFGVSSIVVGLTFYMLGHFQMGRIVYYFPNHVLVGCIGGIGVFIVLTAMEVTMNVTMTLDLDGVSNVLEHWHLLSVVVGLELTLRVLQRVTQDSHGNAKYPLLSPVYYCLITPLFYFGLWIFGKTINQATEGGYFFPPIPQADGGASTSVWQDPHLWDIFRMVDLSTLSWRAILQSTGTMIALTAFSLIHVPINIPAFAISTDVDTDMNAELMAHGYANALSGMFGGLQNYMTYSNSVLYAKSGGKGKVSSLAIVGCTMILFVVGPSIASYLPRCMAGTLLLHIGIDLVLEGVYDSFGNYDHLEYAGIWAIALVMTIWGMTAALIAGVIAALTTYAVQSINYQNPIRQVLTASTLRSSAWTRSMASREILESDASGRSRILVFQLQGHLFFGNVAQLTDTIKSVLKERKSFDESPIVVIVDFTLVVGMDSSAAHAVAKLKKIIHRLFHVEVSIFVTGSDRDGFPCEFALSEALSPEAAYQVKEAGLDYNELSDAQNSPSQVRRGSISVSPGTTSVRATQKISPKLGGRVCESLDDALRFAEDILIAREDPALESSEDYNELEDFAAINMTLEEETYFARKFLRELLQKSDDTESNIDTLWKMMRREEYNDEQVLWESGVESRSMKLLICGELVSIIEDTGASEQVQRGNIVGELGLVHGTKRLTTLMCCSEKAVLYSLDRKEFEQLRSMKPRVAAAVDGLVIRYLAHRVQHVSNRYFHTTLPV